MSEKYLLKRNGFFLLNFRLPKKFGGKLIRVSLNTSDKKLALAARDKFVLPVLHYNSALLAMEALVKNINDVEKEANVHIANLKNIVLHEDEVTLNVALDKYYTYIENSNLSKATKKDYPSTIKRVANYLNCSKSLNMLSKDDAILVRDNLMKENISGTRIDFIFKTWRGFLNWCLTEGIVNTGIDKSFRISLPSVQKINTADISKELADKAMLILPEWTLAPRIARYTAMRLNEVCRMSKENIIKMHDIYCFNLGNWTKTKEPRIIPIAEKLIPYVINVNLSELTTLGHKNDKYNREIKKIKGLEKCKFHSWRVFANSRMMESGVDQAVRMRILGHKVFGSNEIHIGYTAVNLSAMKKAVDTIF